MNKTTRDVSKKVEALARRRTRKFRNGVMLGRSPVEAREAKAMARRYAAEARRAVLVDDVAAELCEECGLPGILRFWYLSFAREVYGLWRRHRPVVYAAELPAVMYKWELRGLDREVLVRVERAVVEALDARGSRGSRVQGVE